MAGENPESPWQVPKFHFRVSMEDAEMSFQEVSGLDSEYDIIEYRAGNSVDFSTVKMPGLRKGSDVTLKKGLLHTDSPLFDYFMNAGMDTISRKTVTIQLLDETHSPMFTWTLKNAFPMKVTRTDLHAQDSEVAVEEIVLAHEGLSFEKA